MPALFVQPTPVPVRVACPILAPVPNGLQGTAAVPAPIALGAEIDSRFIACLCILAEALQVLEARVLAIVRLDEPEQRIVRPVSCGTKDDVIAI